jgi:hypothetical protein
MNTTTTNQNSYLSQQIENLLNTITEEHKGYLFKYDIATIQEAINAVNRVSRIQKMCEK